MALKHIGQGSQLLYTTQSLRLNVFSFWQAALMADISACAVGSLEAVTRFVPVAITSPLRTITAPKGPPSKSIFSYERCAANSINFGS